MKKINTKETYKLFKNFYELNKFSEENNIGKFDEFWFIMELEPGLIFRSIFEYLETGE